MGLLETLGLADNTFSPYLSTGTLLDIAAGAFLPGVDGNMILSGGIGSANGIIGREQRFKSTKAISLAMGALRRYEGSELIFHDTEFAIPDKNRLIAMAGVGSSIDPERIRLSDNTMYDMAELSSVIRTVAKHKIEHRKELTVESPFIDRKTMKPIRMLLPTIVVVDSLSKLKLANEDAKFDKYKLGDSKLNMIYMDAGKAKSQFVEQLPMLAAKAGMYFVMTAHVGNKFQLDPYAQRDKDLQFMKGQDETKGVGSQFNFLTSLLLESRSVEVLQDGKPGHKVCEYPAVYSSPTELNLVSSVVCRCKNNVSGTVIPLVTSQHQGVLREVSNYRFLRKHDNFGLTGSDLHQGMAWFPEVKLEKKTVRQTLSESYELSRTLEILAQLCYVQKYWSTFGLGEVSFKIKPDVFVEKVIAGGSTMISDIVNSRGYWTYAKDDRKYLSIFDILKMLTK